MIKPARATGLERLELHRLTAEQIRIGATNTQLRISGEKKRRVARNKILSHLCSERSYGKFCRLVPLRWTVSVQEAKAEVADGMLTIRLPKIEDRRGVEFKIPVTDVK